MVLWSVYKAGISGVSGCSGSAQLWKRGWPPAPAKGGGGPMFAQHRITGKDRNANKHMVVLTALQKCVVVLFLVPLVFWF